MRKSLRFLTVAAAVAILVPALAPAHDLAVPGKTPASAVAVVSINDTQGLWREFAQSPLNAPIEKFFAQPGLANDPDFAEFTAEKAKAEAEVGFAITGASLLGEVLKGIDFYVLSAAPDAAQGDLNLVVAANFAQAEAAAKTVDHIIKSASADGTETATEMDVAGTKVRALPGQQLYIANDGNVVFTASTERGIREIIEAKGGATLLSSPDFSQAMSGLTDMPGQFWAYGDGSGIASLMEMAPGGGDMAAGAAALKGQTIALVGKIASDHIRVTQFVPAAKFSESDKVVASTTVGPVDGSAKFMPDGGLLYYLNGKLDWSKLLDAAAADAAKLGPEAASQNPLQRENLNAMAMGMGLSFDEEVLPVLGPDLGLGVGSVAFNPAAGGGVPFTADIVISIKVNDAAKAASLMSKFEGMITDQMKQQFENSGVAAPADLRLFEERDANGTKIRAFSPPAGMEAQIPMMPAYAFTQDNYLVLGASEQGLKDALARATGGANFQKGATTGRVAAKSAAGNTNAFYLDLPKLVDIASGPIMMFAGGSMEEGERGMLVTGFELLRAMGLAYVGTSLDAGGKKTDIMLLMK